MPEKRKKTLSDEICPYFDVISLMKFVSPGCTLWFWEKERFWRVLLVVKLVLWKCGVVIRIDGLKTNYGRQLPVSQELKGTVDIILADRNLLERLLAPLKRVMEYNEAYNKSYD